MKLLITGPSFPANVALMHAIKERVPLVSVSVVEFGHEPLSDTGRDVRWIVLAPQNLRDDAPLPDAKFTMIDVTLPLHDQVHLALADAP